MEQNNVEQLIKNQIKARSITPTPEARERLISALNKEPKKKSIYWLRYAIAASVILALFFIGSKMLFKKDVTTPLNEITIQKEEPVLRQKETPFLKKDNNPVVVSKPIDSNSNAIEVELKARKHVIVNKKLINVEAKNNNSVVKTIDNESKSFNNTLTTNAESNNSSIKDKVSIINKLEEEYKYVTAADLIAEMELDSISKRVKINKNKFTNYIKPKQLLVETEKKLFEEKNKNIFKKAARQFNKVKEAVANRNFQN